MKISLRKFVVIAIVVAIGVFAVAEIGLRSIAGWRPSNSQAIIEQVAGSDGDWSVPDTDIGMLARPSRRETVEGVDYTYRIETDRFGFPNDEPWPERPDIVLLGDSLVTGPGVGISGQFSTRIDEALDDATVLNLGLPGASPEHQLRIFRRYAAELSPRWVVSCLWVASDFENARQFAAWPEIGSQWDYEDFRRNHYSEVSSPQAIADNTAAPGLKDRIRETLRSSAVLDEADFLYQSWNSGRTYRASFPDGSKVFLERRKQRYLSRGAGDDPDLQEIFYGAILELRTAAESAGARFVVMLIPSKEEVYTATTDPTVLRTVTQVRTKLGEMGMTVIDMYEPISNENAAAPYFPYDIHLNQRGNQIVADTFVQWLDANN